MNLGYELIIEQTQKLSMTPELIQAIRILQFNTQELSDYVESELIDNPILERDSSVSEEDDIADIRDKIVEDGYEEATYKQWEYSRDEDSDYDFEQFVSEEDTLEDYLLMQLNFSNLKEPKKSIGKYIIEAIDDNGYLTLSIEEISKNMKQPEDLVEDVLDRIHNFEPVGVGARSLSECLAIQLASKGLLSEEIDYIINNMLEDLACNRISKIAKKVSLTNTEVQQISDLIKSLEPKPGRAFATGQSTRYITPDIYVEKINDDFIVTTNEYTLPRLMVSSYYSRLAGEAKSDENLSKYLNDKYNSAIWLIRSIEQRKHTIYNVAKAIVGMQRDFFDEGEKRLKPLTLKEIAEEVGVHESTVSRSINGKYMQCPRGVFELKYFFTSGVVAEDGKGVSSNSVKSFIREIINSEDPKKPYSDQHMVEILKDKGIDISRRTVAKYREGMNILSSSKRRRF